MWRSPDMRSSQRVLSGCLLMIVKSLAFARNLLTFIIAVVFLPIRSVTSFNMFGTKLPRNFIDHYEHAGGKDPLHLR